MKASFLTWSPHIYPMLVKVSSVLRYYLWGFLASFVVCTFLLVQESPVLDTALFSGLLWWAAFLALPATVLQIVLRWYYRSFIKPTVHKP